MIGWAVLAGVGAFCTAAAATVYGYLQDRRAQKRRVAEAEWRRFKAMAGPPSWRWDDPRWAWFGKDGEDWPEWKGPDTDTVDWLYESSVDQELERR